MKSAPGKTTEFVTSLILACALMAAPDLADSQTSVPSSSCADSVSNILGAFEGEWDVQALFRAGPGAWDTTQATVSIARELHGCVLREEYRGTRFGESYDCLALWGANGWPDARVQRFFTHSRHGIFGLASGAFHGDTLILEERFTLRGQNVRQQNLYSRPSGTGFSQLGRRSTDDGLTWMETMRATYRRRAP